MDGQAFLQLIESAFSPLLQRLGFQMDVATIGGRYYSASFRSERHLVSISYEPGDDVVFVVAGRRDGDDFSDFDDRSQSPRLSDLNNRYMGLVSQSERLTNDEAFTKSCSANLIERSFLKAAKELSLVLPKYLSHEAMISAEHGVE